MTEAAQDWLSRDGAETLARRIEGYWREQGTRVVVWLVPMRGGAGGCPSVWRRTCRNRPTSRREFRALP